MMIYLFFSALGRSEVTHRCHQRTGLKSKLHFRKQRGNFAMFAIPIPGHVDVGRKLRRVRQPPPVPAPLGSEPRRNRRPFFPARRSVLFGANGEVKDLNQTAFLPIFRVSNLQFSVGNLHQLKFGFLHFIPAYFRFSDMT